MADSFLSPGTRVREVRKGVVAVPAVSPGRGAFTGVAERGPINAPQLIYSPDEFVEVYGQPLLASFLFDSVAAFFDLGGESCYVNRVAHYTTISDAGTLTAVPAMTTLQSASGGASAAVLESDAASFPAALPAGTLFEGSVDAVPVAGFTITATPAMITGAAGTFAAGGAGDYVDVTIAGVGVTQRVDLSDVGNTLDDYVDEFNMQLVGAYAMTSGGQLRLVTDREGSGAAGEVVAFGGAAAAKTGLSAAAFTNAGPNNVADSNAVTAAEFKALFDAGFPGVVATNGVDHVTLIRSVAGAAASFQFTGPATIAALIPGLDLALHAGAAATAVDTLDVTASSEGVWGNFERISVAHENTVATTVAATSAGARTTIDVASVARVFVGDTISITQGVDVQRSVVTDVDAANKRLTLATTITVPGGGYAGTESLVVETLTLATIDSDGVIGQTFRNVRMSPLAGTRNIENKINNTPGSTVRVTSYSVVPSSTVDPRPAVTASTALGVTVTGSDGGAVVDADYVGSSASNTGLYAYDDIDDFILFAVPGITTVVVQKGMETYLEGRQDLFGIMELPQGLTTAGAVTYAQVTANFASSYEALYFPWVQAVDVRTGGKSSFPPSGYVMGVFARTFQRRNFGKAPAGIEDGFLPNVIGVDTEVKKAAYDVLYPAKINAIQSKRGKGICVFGSRTMDPSGEFGQINVRMVFLVVARIFREGTEFAVFEPNNEETRARVRRFMQIYLRGLREATILSGKSDNEAFFIICDESNNTAVVRRQGKLKCRVGLAVENPSEFVETTLEQDTRKLDAELAAAQTV